MLRAEFDLFRSTQYCCNPSCPNYGEVGGKNLCIKKRKNGQLYCNTCDAKPFSVR